MQERHAGTSLMRKTRNLGLPGCPYYKRVLTTPDKEPGKRVIRGLGDTVGGIPAL